MRRRRAGRSATALVVFGLAAVCGPPVLRAQVPAEDNCRTCHAALGDARLTPPATRFGGDIHATRGLGCADCHGGDPTVAGMEGMDPRKGFVGRPSRRQSIALCGRCHSDAAYMRQFNPSLRVDQVAEYRTSVHGQRLLQQGDTAVAVCVSCHPAHDIKPPVDPASSVHPLNVATTCGVCHASADHMRAYGIPTDQKAKYERSIHWEAMSVRQDLSAPTCNDCHGNHGAAPPGVSSVGNVCGQCHSVQAEYFNRSRHAATFQMLGAPGCATCHNNHEILVTRDSMLGVGDGTFCGACHSADDPGGAVAVALRQAVDTLRWSYDTAAAILSRAERAGMEVSQAQFDLDGANTVLVSARAAIHSFAPDSVLALVDEGLAVTDTAYGRGQRALADLRFRRTGLVLSVLIILALVVGLSLKIRQLRHAPAGSSSREQ
ncbi:MAG: cytochrome c3 family protein [Gemmatimonadales bacterium]|nr:cytochrome c3 family protein [Gemmatimonadales bacterium]